MLERKIINFFIFLIAPKAQISWKGHKQEMQKSFLLGTEIELDLSENGPGAFTVTLLEPANWSINIEWNGINWVTVLLRNNCNLWAFWTQNIFYLWFYKSYLFYVKYELSILNTMLSAGTHSLELVKQEGFFLFLSSHFLFYFFGYFLPSWIAHH